jgi:hypothetical protein
MLIVTEEFPLKKVLRFLHYGHTKLGTRQSYMRIATLVRRLFCHTSGFRRDVDGVLRSSGLLRIYYF